MFHQTAIIYFSRSAGEEVKHKRFTVAGQRGNLFVAQTLYAHSLKQVKGAGFPHFLYDECNQHGAGFGEKMANAFAEVFALGFENVIAVGNDTPALKSEHLIKAAHKLACHAFVAGATQEGGCYLFGINRNNFNFEVIKNVSWQTKHLMQDLKTTFGQAMCLLPLLFEVNSASALKTLLQQHASCEEIITRLRSIFSSLYLRALKNSSVFYPDPVALSPLFGRAP